MKNLYHIQNHFSMTQLEEEKITWEIADVPDFYTKPTSLHCHGHDGSLPMTAATATTALNARSKSNSAKSLVRNTGFN